MHDQDSTLRKSNILIVDDDATMCLLMTEALIGDNYTINAVSDGYAALDYIKIIQPDLVLLDVTMPGLSGFDVCKEIRNTYADSNISIVMVTALEDAASIEKSYDLGATDFISKPINWDTFPYRIQYLIKARNAIIARQQQQLHLEYMEHVSRIITQHKDKDVIMQETMFAMLDIFSADRAILFKPDESQKNIFVVDCETASNKSSVVMDNAGEIIKSIEYKQIEKANISVYPLVTHYNENQPPPVNNPTLKQQMLSALHLKYTHNWYLLIQQNSEHNNWSISDEETFFKISLRLTNMLSRYLLTEELSKSEALLKRTQEIGGLGSWYWNATVKTLSWSDEIYKIHGYRQHDFTPNFDKFFVLEFVEDIDRLELLKELRCNNISSYQIDHRITTQDNVVRWVHEQCIGSYSDSGELLEINGVVQDITDSRIKKEQEVHNSKMEAIGQITSGVAHDFGNLMTVAKGNLELLEESISESLKLSADDLELLEDTRSAVNDSVELTRQLLSFSRKKPIAPVYVNIKKTLAKFQTLLKKTLGVSISLSIDVNDNLRDILVDPGQFESALLNIIINARNAMPDGGNIVLNVEEMATTQSQQIIRNVDNTLGDKCLCISISDNGIGMSDNVLERAIEPFYTTSNTNGTGLGLSMVYGFMNQSGGDLIIHSEPDRGTTIHLQFPIGQGFAVKKVKAEQNISLQNIHATILVVEDREPVRQFAVRCLQEKNINILQADNAATAREILASNAVDVMFSDIVMPGDMNGHQLAAWARIEYPHVKILLTTAMERDINETSTLNSDKPNTIENTLDKEKVKTRTFPLLFKPYSKDDLVTNIANLLK